jgi:hypothetical protein
MKITLGKLGMAMLLTLGVGGAFAQPLPGLQDQESARIERQMKWAEASLARRDDGGNQEYGGRGGHGGRGSYDGGNGHNDQFRNGSQQQGGYWQAPQDDGRRGGRMSPEDRRELRRQIDEAGRNIYAPGRR